MRTEYEIGRKIDRRLMELTHAARRCQMLDTEHLAGAADVLEREKSRIRTLRKDIRDLCAEYVEAYDMATRETLTPAPIEAVEPSPPTYDTNKEDLAD